jgi:hypothetical protein
MRQRDLLKAIAHRKGEHHCEALALAKGKRQKPKPGANCPARTRPDKWHKLAELQLQRAAMALTIIDKT